MSLFEEFLLSEVAIDSDIPDNFSYDSEQAYVDCPVRFATVRMELVQSIGLNRIADRIRREKGFKPFFAYDSDHDDEAWYDFFVGIKDLPWLSPHLSLCIWFTVDNSDSDDDCLSYDIELDEYEKRKLYEILNKDSIEITGMSLVEHLVEARQEICLRKHS